MDFCIVRSFPLSCIGILCWIVSSAHVQAQSLLSAREGRVQYIHAAADPALSRVNVWIARNGQYAPLLLNARFGSATDFQKSIGSLIPSIEQVSSLVHTVYYTYGTDSTLSSAPAMLPLAMVGGFDNIVISLGILQSRIFNFSFSPSQRSTVTRLINIIDATVPADSSLRVWCVHGSTDAPRMEMVLRQTGQVLARLEYTQTSVATVPLGDYTIDVRYATNQTVVASFGADFRSLSMAGQRITLVLSGFLEPQKNLDGIPLALIAATMNPIMVDSTRMASSVLLPSVPKPVVTHEPQTTVQVIDVTGDVQRSPLRAFIQARIPNSTTTTTAPIGQALQFRQATQTLSTTPVVIVVSQRPLVVTQAILSLDNVVGSFISAAAIRVQPPQPGRPPQQPAITVTATAQLQRGWNKIIASGVLDTNSFAKNPDGLQILQKFTNFVDRMDSVPSDSVRVLLFQGVTDARRMRFDIRNGDSLAVLRYGEGTFLTLPAQNCIVDLTSYDNDEVIGSFVVPLDRYAGERVSILTSGFLEPTRNSNGQPFGVILVPEMPSTTNSVRLLEAAPALTGVAETTLQVVNASADPAFTTIGTAIQFPITGQATGIFLPVVRSLRFSSADTALTSIGTFIPLLKNIVGVPLTFYVTRPNTVNASTVLYEQSGFSVVRGANVVLVSGLLHPLDFLPNPEGRLTKVRCRHFVDNQRTIAQDSVRLLLFHSSTDAPTVDIVARGQTRQKLATLGIGEGVWVNIPLNDYVLELVATGKGNNIASFDAPLRRFGMGGQRMTLAITGFINQPPNQWLPELGVYAVSNGAIRPIATTNVVSTRAFIEPPFTNAITATGVTISTSSFVITTSANGQTVSTVTVSKTIFVPNPLPAGTPSWQFFPTSQLTLATTTLTVTTTVNASMMSVVVERHTVLYDGTVDASTTSTTHIYATTSTLRLSRMLDRLYSTSTVAERWNDGVTDDIKVHSLTIAPNPAHDRATVSYTLSDDGMVRVEVYNTLGQRVLQVQEETFQHAGTHAVTIPTAQLQSGMYDVRVLTKSGIFTSRLIVLQ
ncbi:MAG: T9SS type A sorting domain-containing protein [Bacteroidota bacterium]|nr:T9SS type A sorting domain-containing protein [Candidatus Kapabacteria bacterium]MDW8220472.1 T9SS type A sorting domain-containing protein [Bacteroidota bacterium]